ncbi:MAG: mannose-1-phosphate guanylyltransferase [Paludibacteraceae bacterium]|nr:mannose-1-phosphate guanylyltransferase [Paludibacteraceae bacterium]
MQNNWCIIMAGGVGSRFWPYSRTARPKQFLDFFGTGRSLIQMTVDRILPLVPQEHILVVTNAAYRDLVREQLPDISEHNILCEPARRNTAPCIAYAVAHIAALTDNANILVASSDALIINVDEFRRVIGEGLQFVSRHDALLTIGMKPTRPETGYGYIQFEQGEETFRKVKTFTEKPNRELAEVFLNSGEFLWNAGIFLWNMQSITRQFEKHLPTVMAAFYKGRAQMGTPDEQAFINEMFPSLPSISIDYGIMEKADNVYVCAADFGWSDLGTWGSLHDLSEKDDNNNVTLHCDAQYYDAHGNVVALEKGKLAVVEGISDCIIAESDGVLLVCRMQDEQQIRQFVVDAEQRFDGKYN